jgi:hypothetical protein
MDDIHGVAKIRDATCNHPNIGIKASNLARDFTIINQTCRVQRSVPNSIILGEAPQCKTGHCIPRFF